MSEDKNAFGKRNETAKSDKIVPKSPSDALQPKEAPPPPKRAKQARNGLVVVMNFVFSCLMFLALIMVATFYFGKSMFQEPGPLTTEKTITIKEGDSVKDIADQLEQRGIISSNFIFRTGVRLSDAAGSMKVGEYAFKPHMSMREVMDTIRSGKGILYKVTIPEGWTNNQIYKRVAENEHLTGDMPQMLLEGELMPDTYSFSRGTSRADVIERMRLAQEKAVADIWNKRQANLPLKTPEEMVILASIVEKETGKQDERPHVASVFINRLRKGMRLQSDPTIIYGLFGSEGKPADYVIKRSEIDKPTAFNTYQIDGLPPTPIANPGRAALEAVANPSKTDDYFFVADGTGGHVFSKTLEEHEANVKRWRIIEKRLKEEAKASEDKTANSQDKAQQVQ